MNRKKDKPAQVALDAGDVGIAPISAECGDCDGLGTHLVILDMRGCGLTSPVSGPLCLKCARACARRLKSSLPQKVRG